MRTGKGSSPRIEYAWSAVCPFPDTYASFSLLSHFANLHKHTSAYCSNAENVETKNDKYDTIDPLSAKDERLRNKINRRFLCDSCYK